MTKTKMIVAIFMLLTSCKTYLIHMKDESPKKGICMYVASHKDDYILIMEDCDLFKVGDKINKNNLNVDTIYRYRSY